MILLIKTHTYKDEKLNCLRFENLAFFNPCFGFFMKCNGDILVLSPPPALLTSSPQSP